MSYPKISGISTYRVADENRIRIEWEGAVPDVPLVSKFLVFRKFVWEKFYTFIGDTNETFFDDVVDVDFRKGVSVKYAVGYESGIEAINLLNNGDFENWNQNLPDGWEISGTASIFQDTSNVANGTYSLGISAGAGEEESIYQNVDLTSPGVYKFSAYFKKDSSVEPILLRIYDSDGNLIYSESISDADLTEHVVYLCVEEAGTIKIEFYVSNTTNPGNYYIDYARFQEVGNFSEGSQITIEPQARAGLNGYLVRILKEEVRRNTEIYYPNFAEQFILLSRKYSGNRCSVCWDADLMQVTNPYCETCFGTGYEGGYNKYVLKGQFQYPSEEYLSEPQETGEWWTGRVMELIAEPRVPIRSRDIVVRKDGTRWMVGRVRYTRIAGAIIHQIATIYMIDTNHIAYKIPTEFVG